MEQQNIQLNTFEGGMDMDTDVAFAAKNTYRYSQNMRLITKTDGTNGIIQNIEYVKKYSELEELKNQIIINVIAARVPNDDFELVNTAIILTQDRMDKSHNHIYLVSNFNSSKLTCKCVLKIIWHMTKDSNITMLFNYETKSVYKLYVNDPSTGMKIINLAEYIEEWGDKPVIENPSYFNSNPTATLQPLKLNGYTSGNLKAGAYQYFYKLSTASGIETTLSPGSEVIYLAENNFDDALQSGGYADDAVTGSGISLKVWISNDQFDYIRFYRVYWKDNINEPEVDLFTEDRLKKGNYNLTVNDSLQQVLNKITLEELNDIIPYTFQAQNMIQYKNRLFFANIESTTWDIPKDYDTRAYRANSKGLVRLTNNAGNNIVNDVALESIIDGSYVIEDDFDAINPMNALDIYPLPKADNEYAYDRSGNYGGEGKNISFTIVHTKTYESRKNSENFTQETLKNSSDALSNFTGTSLPVKAVGGSNKVYTPIYLGKTEIISYANPAIASRIASYQRDEVYRFGIVFYNQQHVPTPVHWICDIRFPSGDTDGFEAFDVSPNDSAELIAKPLGLNFEIKGFPDGAVAAEIVRCDRTSGDRTIVAQGMLNNTVFFTGIEFPKDFDPKQSNGVNDIRSPMFPTTSTIKQSSSKKVERDDKSHIISSLNKNTYYNSCYDVKLFVSPETCFNNKSNIIEPGYYICPIYKAFSKIQSPGFEYDGDDGNLIQNAVDMSTERKHQSMGIMGVNLIFVGDVNDPNSGIHSAVIKYYKLFSANSLYKNNYGNDKTQNNGSKFIANIQSAKMARTDLPNQDNGGIESYKETYIDVINGRNYTNNAVAVDAFSIGGVNQLIGIDSLEVDGGHILYNGFDKPSSVYNGLPTLICNIKKRVIPYGGASYLARAANAYISCGGYMLSSATNVTVFGGDTFLTNFTFQNASVFTKNDFNENGVRYHKSVFAYIPVESTINTYFRYDDYFMKNKNVYLHTNPGTINGNSQDFAMYAYNSGYSVSDGGVNYAPGSTNQNISSTEFNRYRIVCTEQKSAGESIDSWSKSKFANTLDLDSKYGSITSLIEFKNQMLALQENALSQISVDDRALITDQNGASLVLGTGGILNRYDVLINNYGAGIVNDPSVISSSQNIYWYDNNKNVICAYGSNGFHILSKEKKVQSFLNSLAQVSNNTVTSFFNDKENELWMKMKGTCLVYNEYSDCFTSFYTHVPEYGLRFYDRLITLEGKQFYHTDTFGEENEVKLMTAKLEFAINENPYITKVFDTQDITGNLIDPNNNKLSVIEEIKFNTKTQNSFTLNNNDVQCREDSYKFAIPRQDRGEIGNSDEKQQDILNRSFSPRMRGKYLNCEYTFNCDNDRGVQIPFIKTTFRQSNV